ncbi:MAG TPA: hypothetical protein IAD22_01880 [Candidatus Limousia pullorum]|uniref:Uncharacterized protein n=1 Tax=Candidatus Limousia pullorum TaxID=2840860 RepID=A0A9D1LXC1_9FIRM|nr:hypothetical protein [Candidatus Limousia pullorum]
MKKNNKRDTINLFFSAFLVTAYVICSFFFSQLASTMNPNMSGIINVLIYSVFGVILFYATRVGEGKQVLRFSPMTLVFLVLPTFYIILAYLIPAMPFGSAIAENALIMTVAAVAFGYGLPYTFVSGYEIAPEEEEQQEEENAVALLEDKTASEDSTEETKETQVNEEEVADLENTEYFPEEELEILGEQDMLDAENNAEEAAFYYGEEAEKEESSEDSEEAEDEKSEKVD